MTEVVLGIYLLGVAYSLGWHNANQWAITVLITMPVWKFRLMALAFAILWPAVAVIVGWSFWSRRGY